MKNMKAEQKNLQLNEKVAVQPALETVLDETLERLSNEEMRQSPLGRLHALVLELGQEQVDQYLQAGVIQSLTTLRRGSIRITTENDWVLFRDREGHEWALLRHCPMVADVWGISLTAIRCLDREGRWVPAEEREPEAVIVTKDRRQVKRWTFQFDAYCSQTGRKLLAMEANRDEDEDFVGRSGAAWKGTGKPEHDADPRVAARTLCESKAIRILSGLVRVPPSEIAAAWEGTLKRVEAITRGSGYGAASERAATKVASEDVKKTRKELGEEILRRVGGDKADAKMLLIELTANPEKDFKGFDSVERLTQEWQVDQAWQHLRIHPTFGDKPEGRQPGDEEEKPW